MFKAHILKAICFTSWIVYSRYSSNTVLTDTCLKQRYLSNNVFCFFLTLEVVCVTRDYWDPHLAPALCSQTRQAVLMRYFLCFDCSNLFPGKVLYWSFANSFTSQYEILNLQLALTLLTELGEGEIGLSVKRANLIYWEPLSMVLKSNLRGKCTFQLPLHIAQAIVIGPLHERFCTAHDPWEKRMLIVI